MPGVMCCRSILFSVFLLLSLLPCRTLADTAGEEGGSSRLDAISDFWNEHFSSTGWIELVQSMRTYAPHDEVTSRVHGRLELSAEVASLNGFLSLDAEKNWTIPALDGLSVREAWLEHVGSGWDIRVGRQLIIWGKADGVRITDNVCPTDFSDYLNRNIDEMRIPVTAAKLRFLSNTLITEFIWIPEFKSAKLATGNNPWALERSFPSALPVRTNSAGEPSSWSLEDSEFALRVSSYMAGFDVSLSAFYTWDDTAASSVSVRDISGGRWEIVMEQDYHRILIYGFDFAKPWSDFVFRGEAAYFQGRYLSTSTGGNEKHDVLKYLVGVDWSPGGNWSVTAQLLDEFIMNYDRGLVAEEHSPQATLNVSKNFFNEQLTVSDMVYVSLNDGEFFNRLQAAYELADGMELTIGWDKFYGDDGSYGVYRRNSQIWGKLRFSF